MILTYNNITLQLLKTNTFARQPVYSSDNSDWICNRYLLDVSAIFNPGATSYNSAGVQGSGQFPAVTDVWVRHKLLEPRAQLTYQDEAGNTSLSSPPAGNTRDAMYGPHPLNCTVKAIAGSKTFLVNYQIETFLNDCPNQSGLPDPLISNRWSDQHTVGNDQMTTITYQGESKFRMDALEDAGRVADYFRGRCIPGVPLGFRREGLNCQTNSIGDTMTWVVVDKQQYYYLGDGSNGKASPDVLSFVGTYTQQSTSSGSALAPSGLLAASVTMQVMGKPTAQRVNLLLFAVKEAINRLNLPAGAVNPATQPIITRIAVSEELHMPAINFHVEVTMPAAVAGKQGMGGLRFGAFSVDGQAFQFQNPYFDPTGKCPTLGADNNTRSSSYTGLAFAAALQAACTSPSAGYKSPPGSGSISTAYQYAPGFQAVVAVSDSPTPPTAPLYSQSNATTGPYTEYRIDARLDGDNHVVQLPTTGTVNGQPSGCEVAYLANRTNTVAFDWTAERQFSPPTIPDVKIYDPSYKLARDTYIPASVAILNDGFTPVYRVSGRYEYVLDSPVSPATPLIFPTTPNFALAFGTQGDSDYQTGIIGPVSQSSSGGGSSGGGGSSAASFAGLDH